MISFLFTHYGERLLFGCVETSGRQQLDTLITCLHKAFDGYELMVMRQLPIEAVNAGEVSEAELRQLRRDWDTQLALLDLLRRKPQLGNGERHTVLMAADDLLRRELRLQNASGVRRVGSRSNDPGAPALCSETLDVILQRIHEAGNEPIMLTDDELFKLAAYEKNLPRPQVSFARQAQEKRDGVTTYQRELDAERNRRASIRRTLDYNARIREHASRSADDAGQPGDGGDAGVAAPRTGTSTATEANPKPKAVTPTGGGFQAKSQGRNSASHATPARSYTVSEMLERTGVSDSTLNKYAKIAGVNTPERGKRNHRYTADEARAVLEAILNNSSDRTLKDRCRDALARLEDSSEIQKKPNGYPKTEMKSKVGE